MRIVAFIMFLCLGMVGLASAERINQEGRILGPQIAVTNGILFNTAQADAVVSSLQIYPLDNAWNEDISKRPVLTNSAAMMALVYSDLGTRTNLRAFNEMNFIFVPTNQPTNFIDLYMYPDESDPSPYPIPTNMPVELWPSQTGSTNLTTWQVTDDKSDRHSIIVQPDLGGVWETWRTYYTNGIWRAACGALFNLNSNALRPDGYTSADAGGLSMFPALVRYDECERGMVEHAMRLIVKRTRKAYIYPANHYASTNTNPDLPAMGNRFRLKSSYTISTNWTKEEKAVLLGLKKYGAIVADNGGFFSISVTPDDRYPAGCFDHLATVGVTNFEVIDSTTQFGGPRSPGAPLASAGIDRTATVGAPLTLGGYVTVFTNTPPVTNLWKVYSGPGTVNFDDVTRTNATVTFTNVGTYTLLLGAYDNLHTVAYDATVVTVGTPPIVLQGSRSGTNVVMTWSGGAAPYVVEQNAVLGSTNWTTVVTTNGTSVTVPIGPGMRFYRVH